MNRYRKNNMTFGEKKMYSVSPRIRFSRKLRPVVLLLAVAPLVAYPLVLSDYLNQSSVTASSAQFETNLVNNNSEVQIIPNAELIIVKEVVNDDGGDLVLGDFGVTTDAGTPVFGAGVVSGTTTTYTSATLYVPPGTYTLNEVDVPGYTEGAWSCSAGVVGNSAFDAGEVTLSFGEQTVCTIVNDDVAPLLTLNKTVTNDNGGDLLVGDFDISIDGSEVVAGVANAVAANTDIEISELNLDGYTEGAWSCVDASGLTTGLPTAGLATGEIFQLEPGSDVSCSIVNDDIAPQLTLVKNLTNDNGGALTVADFDISIDTTEVISGAANTVLANTDITISELDLNGYTEGAWSCIDANSLTTGLPTAGAATGETFQISPGSDITCSIDNDDIAPQLTLVKNLINDNGGDLTVGDFDISIDAVEVVSGVANNVLANTDIEISELDLDGYTEGTWSCVDASSLTAGLPAAGAATGETFQVSVGSDVTCTIENNDIAPQLTLTKTITNDDGGNLVETDFDLSIDGVEIVSGAANIVLANTDIEISELDLPGYTTGTWACSDVSGLTTGLPTAGVATGEIFQIEPGSDVRCEITNDDIAPQLTLTKTLINDNGGLKTIADFDVSVDGVEIVNGAVNTVLANTDIEISELDLDGYTEGAWSCVDGSGLTSGLPTAGTATSEIFQLAPGADVNCSIVNDDLAPVLTLAKTLLNDDGGDLTIADFNLSIDGVVVTSGAANPVAANQVITISELDLDGYTEGAWSCVDASGLTTGLPSAGVATATDITLVEGADVTCSITNDDIAPQLTLAKTLVNDNGGDLTIGDFDISVDGVEVTSGTANTVAANIDIEISELDLDGYVEGTWACVDANGLTTGLPAAGSALGEIFQLKQGSDVTCSITNDDIAPQLTLTKTLVNDNGGDLAITDFDIAIDGVEVVDSVANVVVANTDIEISELDLDGYQEGAWACVDANGLASGLPTAGVATGEIFQLTQGADVTCSIINDDIAPKLTLAKTVVNDNGGNLVIGDFDISVDGVEVNDSIASVVLANTDIEISELALPGYVAGTWSCVDASGLTTGLPTAGVATGEIFQLKQGSDVTCSISNDDIAPKLTLTKTVINDNGGNLAIGDFDISVDGVEVIDSVASVVLANTDIVISELDLNGYTEGTWSCLDANALTTGLPTAGVATGETFQLTQGADVTCAITNDDIAPQLTLTKTLVNDNGGDLTIADFDISIDGTEVTSGVANPVAANVDIEISELDLDGYVEGAWACVDANGLATGLPAAGVATSEIFQLTQGSDVTCSITNDDIAPQLTLVKTVVNDNGGNGIVDDFDISIDGVEVATGVANVVQANTNIVVSELDLAPYAEGSWSCVDATGLTSGLPAAGLATGVTIQLKQGADVTCSISNNDLGIDLSIAKSVDDPTPNIGQTITFTLTVLNNGPDVATSVTVNDVVPAGFTYVPGSIAGGTSSNDADPTGAGLDWVIGSMPVGTPSFLTFDAVVNLP